MSHQRPLDEQRPLAAEEPLEPYQHSHISHVSSQPFTVHIITGFVWVRNGLPAHHNCRPCWCWWEPGDGNHQKRLELKSTRPAKKLIRIKIEYYFAFRILHLIFVILFPFYGAVDQQQAARAKSKHIKSQMPQSNSGETQTTTAIETETQTTNRQTEESEVEKKRNV